MPVVRAIGLRACCYDSVHAWVDAGGSEDEGTALACAVEDTNEATVVMRDGAWTAVGFQGLTDSEGPEVHKVAMPE
jgi:hypothetical protein